MDKNIQTRIQSAVDELCDGNKSEFCRRIGRPAQAIKDIIGGKLSAPGYDLIYDILSSDLGISPKWLILGDGEMLSKNNNEQVSASFNVVGTATTVIVSNVDELASAFARAISSKKD